MVRWDNLKGKKEKDFIRGVLYMYSVKMKNLREMERKFNYSVSFDMFDFFDKKIKECNIPL